MAPLWQILICSVPARHQQLVRLLRHLDRQSKPYCGAVEVLVDRDPDAPVGVKRSRLLEAATADWVCFVDDDDWVADRYVERIAETIVYRADIQYLGFNVGYSVDGVAQKPVLHSLRHERWSEDSEGFYRGISHLNPIRRECALTGLPFQPGFGEDQAWAERVAASGAVRAEAYIDAVLYEYRYSTSGSLFRHGPRPTGEPRPLPRFRHVQELA